MSRIEHWDRVYRSKTPTEVSWYTPHLRESLRLIREVAPPSARILDVGGGASTLVDDLLEIGYGDITVLDVSEAALEAAQRRLGDRRNKVRWIAADVTAVELPENAFDLWHDRAVFHFLTAAADRRAYVEKLHRSVADGGHVVLATFSLTGPTKCSGLDVMRYDAQGLSRELGERFTLTTHLETSHVTPAGREQNFLFCRFEKNGRERRENPPAGAEQTR